MERHPSAYTKPQLMACCGARAIADGDIVLVGTGFPTMAANIATHTHAPNALLLQESGVVDARPKRTVVSVFDPCLNPGAAMIGGLVEIMGMFLQGGWVNVGFLSGAQVDKYGNINTTVIGDYYNPTTRLPGSGGANPIGCLAERTIISALHDKRRLVERVDFITTPGYIDGPHGRSECGLAPGNGPYVIITNKAVLKFDEETKEAYLATYHPDSSIDEVLSLTPWNLKVADDVYETPPPTAEELRAIHEFVDPDGVLSTYERRGYL